jgi:hypothetical protein
MKNGIKFLEPVAGALPKAIKSFEEKPIFILVSIRIPCRWSDDSGFLRRKNALAESVFAISLFKAPAVLGRQTNQEVETIKPKNRCKTIAFGPVAPFTITQNNNARLGPKRQQLFIL